MSTWSGGEESHNYTRFKSMPQASQGRKLQSSVESIEAESTDAR